MFQGLSTALTALYAAREALDTTGNNIANVNTKGYSRERVDQAASGPVGSSFWATSRNAVGTGVTVTGISRITDQFLQARALAAHGTQGQLNAGNDALTGVQNAFNEPSDNGLQAQMSKFWSSWDDMATNPDLPTRTQLVEQTQTLVSNINAVATSLKQQSTDTMSSIKGDVTSINTMAKSIADLNKAIQGEVNLGNQPNALEDQRDLLLSNLASIVNISTTPGEAGALTVNLGGQALVRGNTVTALQVDTSGTPAVFRWDSDGDPTTTTEGTPANVTGGQVGGKMDAFNNVIPKYQTLLNTVATNLISTVNTQHALGQDASGNAGGTFFTGTDASTLAIDPAIVSDPMKIAAAGNGLGALDVSNAQAMANLSESTTGPDASYRQLVGVLGVEAQRATNQATIQQTITNGVDASVQSVSGVNLDEEMTNMVQFQRAYQSAAKYLSVINDTMDTLMGLIR